LCQPFPTWLFPTGFERSKRQVIAVVHIGEQTLHKRVMEFANTTSADLLADDFEETVR
jgi:transcription factor IIIB subunit 2